MTRGVCSTPTRLVLGEGAGFHPSSLITLEALGDVEAAFRQDSEGAWGLPPAKDSHRCSWLWSGDSACPPLGAGPTTENLNSHHTNSDGQSKPQAQGLHLEQTALYSSELSNTKRVKQLAWRLAHGGCSIYSSGNCYYLQHRESSTVGLASPGSGRNLCKALHTMLGTWQGVSM